MWYTELVDLPFILLSVYTKKDIVVHTILYRRRHTHVISIQQQITKT